MLGALLGSVGIAFVVSRPSWWVGWVVLVPAAVLLLGTRRSFRLRSDVVVAQGRVFRRVVALHDLRQAGVCPDGRPWLQRRGGQVTLLRMVPLVDYGSGHPGPTLVEQLRSAAAASGAGLEPPLRSPEQPPTTRPQLLGL